MPATIFSGPPPAALNGPGKWASGADPVKWSLRRGPKFDQWMLAACSRPFPRIEPEICPFPAIASRTNIFWASRASTGSTSSICSIWPRRRSKCRGRWRRKRPGLRGRTQINLFFEASTRTQSSFELAGKRLGADVMNMSVATSSVKKGETLIDTAITLNAMRPDIIVVRHHQAGAAHLLARKVDCAVVNAGDGAHEHPTQALLDALTMRRAKGRIEGLIVAICGDVLHSPRRPLQYHPAVGAWRAGAGGRAFDPDADRDRRNWASRCSTTCATVSRDADIVMMLRLQRERMQGAFIPSTREYFRFFGLDEEKLAYAKPDALVMHPGPMNRGVEIDSSVADGAQSLIREQVEMGVAVRMAVLEALARNLPNG